MLGRIEASHAQTQQGRGIGHGADDTVVTTGHLGKASNLDAGRDGDEQLARKGAQLGNQCCQHAGHQLWFDRQHDHLGMAGSLGIGPGGANAVVVGQRIQFGLARVGGSDKRCRITRLDQTGDDAAAHVACADEGERPVLLH